VRTSLALAGAVCALVAAGAVWGRVENPLFAFLDSMSLVAFALALLVDRDRMIALDACEQTLDLLNSHPLRQVDGERRQ
jgi:hypothetical protein